MFQVQDTLPLKGSEDLIRKKGPINPILDFKIYTPFELLIVILLFIPHCPITVLSIKNTSGHYTPEKQVNKTVFLIKAA